MRILFLDCSSGISGDMTVGALCDLGVKPSALEWELSKLEIGDFHMHFERTQRQHVTGIKFSIHEGAVHHEHGESHHHSEGEAHAHEHESHSHEDEHHSHEEHGGHSHAHGDAHDHEPPHEHVHAHDEHHTHDHEHEHGHGDHHHVHGRSHREIRALIEKSELTPFVKERSLAVFRRIAIAEGKIHGQSPEDVGFHEVGAFDSIADIICACAGIEALGVEKVFVSHLHEGHGVIKCAHGFYPVPAPATLEILQGIPVEQIDEPHELVTPTGAAIVAEFGAGFGLMPRMKIEKIGYGLGTRELKSRPNVLRAVLGDLAGG